MQYKRRDGVWTHDWRLRVRHATHCATTPLNALNILEDVKKKSREEHNLTSYDIGQKGNLWCFLSTFFNKGPTHLWNKLQLYIWYPISNVTSFSPHTAEVSLAGSWVITCYLYILVQHTSKQSSVGWSSHLNWVKDWTARWIKVTSTRTLARTGMKHQQQQQQHNRIAFSSWNSVNNLSITCTYSSLDFHKGRCKRW